MNIAIIHCDGSYSRYSKRGSYGVVIQYKGKIKEFSEVCEGVTSSTRAEMLGAIRAIEVYGPRADRIKIHTDCQVLVDGITKHMPKWLETNRLDTIANKDLWLKIISLIKQYIVEWVWVKGHYTDIHNNRADALAREALEG